MQMQQTVSQAEDISASVQDTAAETAQQYGDPTRQVGYAGGTLAQGAKGLNQQIESTRNEYGLSKKQFVTAATEKTLDTASQTAESRNQIVQASNTMSGLLTSEPQQLDTDSHTANTAIFQDRAAHDADKAADEKPLQDWLSATNWRVRQRPPPCSAPP